MSSLPPTSGRCGLSASLPLRPLRRLRGSPRELRRAAHRPSRHCRSGRDRVLRAHARDGGVARAARAGHPRFGRRPAARERGRARTTGLHARRLRVLSHAVRARPADGPSVRTPVTPRRLRARRRTGPDLADVGTRQPSETWHLIHLYDPRAVVPQSVMPAYRWYFAEKDQAGSGDVVVPVPAGHAPRGKVIVAGPDAKALVGYLLSLKQAKVSP